MRLAIATSALCYSDEFLVLGFVDMLSNEFLHIRRTFHAGQASIEDDLGYPHGSLNFDLQLYTAAAGVPPEGLLSNFRQASAIVGSYTISRKRAGSDIRVR